MSSKALSPTASLLRTSRLFSLPPPLPRPFLDFKTSTGTDASSDTATLPYPIHQAIATPPSSLGRGDWGLKRNLPLHSTTGSANPTLRVTALDTIEHITEFEPASNHVKTLQKWQSLNIPMTTYTNASSFQQSRLPRSVYEDDHDNTYIEKDYEQARKREKRRWRFEGPWITGMSPKAFEDYVATEIKNRKEEFRHFIRQKVQGTETSENMGKARQKGLPIPSADDPVEVDDLTLGSYIKVFRDEFGLGSKLARYIREFLDLPDLPIGLLKEEHTFSRSPNRTAANDALQDVFHTARQGPPKTHPGAGLSYIKTGAFLANHPILGPRSHPEPVPARVVVPSSKSAPPKRATIGVAGVVTKEALNSRAIKVGEPLNTSIRAEEPGIMKPDFSRPGGTKIWVEPERASIDSQGKIELVANHADRGNVGFHTGEEIDAWLRRLSSSSPKSQVEPLITVPGPRFSDPLDAQEYRSKQSLQRAKNSAKTIRVIEEILK